MTSVTGLTFFFSGGTFSAIHAHSHAEPYAVIPPESLSRRNQAYVSWVYVPLAKDDEILALGLRGLGVTELMKPHCIMV